MKKLIVLIPLVISSFVYGNIYYVATNGNDSNDGMALTTPWFTWQKAFSFAATGDTVYFRGGIYYTDNVVECIQSGSESNLIYFLNYPGETPILDGVIKSNGSSGILLQNKEYIYLRGLSVRNNNKISTADETSGIVIDGCNHIAIENCATLNNGKFGFYINNPDNIILKNCDSYNNTDTLSVDNPGDGGDGFFVNNEGTYSDPTSYVNLTGCRAWNNSGDGFDFRSSGSILAEYCWSWNNGIAINGTGAGFRFGSLWMYRDLPIASIFGSNNLWICRSPAIRIFHCISFMNASEGFTTIEGNTSGGETQIFNNTSYRNSGYGYSLFNTDGDDLQEMERAYKNNISYEDGSGEVYVQTGAIYSSSHNSWDHPSTPLITDADFLSTDSTGISGMRNDDGSLPYLNFLRLEAVSDLKDAGIITGLSFIGMAPDMGAYELGDKEYNELPFIIITEPVACTIFMEPADFTVTTESSSNEGSIAKVEFFYGTTKIAEVTSPPWSFIWKDVPAGEYDLTAVATDNLNGKATSSVVTILIKPIPDELIIYTFPNPTNGLLTVYFDGDIPNEATIIIYDFYGRTVFRKELIDQNTFNMDLSYFIRGIYIMSIQTVKGIYNSKLIIE